jgi:hypothetical protein
MFEVCAQGIDDGVVLLEHVDDRLFIMFGNPFDSFASTDKLTTCGHKLKGEFFVVVSHEVSYLI